MLYSAAIASLFLGVQSCTIGGSAYYITFDDFILHLSHPELESRSYLDESYIQQRSCTSGSFDVCIIGDYPFFFTDVPGVYNEVIEGEEYRIDIYMQNAHAPESPISIVEVKYGSGTLTYEYDRRRGITEIVEHIKHHDGFEALRVFILQDGNYLGCQAEN